MSSGAAAVPTRPTCTCYPRHVCTRASCLCFGRPPLCVRPLPPSPPHHSLCAAPACAFLVCVGSGFLSCFVTLPVVCGLFMSRTLAPSLALKWTLKLLRRWCWFAVRWWKIDYVAFSAFVQPDCTARARRQDAVVYKNRSLRKNEKPSKEEKKSTHNGCPAKQPHRRGCASDPPPGLAHRHPCHRGGCVHVRCGAVDGARRGAAGVARRRGRGSRPAARRGRHGRRIAGGRAR